VVASCTLRKLIGLSSSRAPDMSESFKLHFVGRHPLHDFLDEQLPDAPEEGAARVVSPMKPGDVVKLKVPELREVCALLCNGA
jgi:hypothetical protein